jgi:putative Mg2+ transporter-C (MgtC) family protein
MISEIDLPLLTVVGRSLLAALLGFAIGWERRASGSPVRARIIALVAMSTAALTSISMQMAVADLSRILAGLLTSIGFIGAGVVMRNDSGEVRGLMTATALWAMTVVAIVIGAGSVVFGILLAALVYVVIAWDEWPAATRFRRREAQKAKTAGRGEQVAELQVRQPGGQEE